MSRCSGTNRHGLPCRSTIIIPGTDPPKCRIHSLSVEERKAQSARGGRRKGQPARDRIKIDFDECAWLLRFIIQVVNGTRRPSSAFDYLAPIICETQREREELREMLEGINPPLEEEAPDGLEVARRNLERLYYEGRILLEELPPGVL